MTEDRQHVVNPDTDRCVMCGRNTWNRERVPVCDYDPNKPNPVTNSRTNYDDLRKLGRV